MSSRTRRARFKVYPVIKRSLCTLVFPIFFTLVFISPAAAVTTLHDAVLQAVINNPEVLERWNALQAAQHEKNVAKGLRAPRVDLSARIGYTRQSSDFSDENFTPREASLELTQLLFDGLATRNTIKKFDQLSLVSYFELLDISEEIALEATRAYLDTLKYRELLALATSNYAQHLEVYSQVEERVSAGVGRGVDLQQAAGRLALAESNRITEAANLHDVNARYLRIVGEIPEPDLADPGQIAAVLPGSIQDALRLAFARNPSFLAAMENLKATEFDRSARKGAYWPKLEARARQDVGYDRNNLSGNSEESTVELVMNFNLFRGGSDAATIRQFTSRREQAREQKNKVCRDVRQTLDIAYNDVKRYELQLKQLDQHQKSIANAREAYKKQFDIGQRSLLDLLDTENEYFQARRTYVAALYEYQQARARTDAGMGNLITSLGVQQDVYNPAGPLEGLNPSAIDPDAICPLIGIPLAGLDKIVYTPPVVQKLPQPLVLPAAAIPAAPKEQNIFFGRWKTNITLKESAKIAEIAEWLRDQPGSYVYLSGHASSRGTDAINKKLSRDRAATVREKLIKEFNISPSRIVISWYSSERPVADNATEEGKSKNRRVLARILSAQDHENESRKP